MEKAADPEDLQMIRDLFGSRAQTIINLLLAFDAYFDWYYPLVTSVPLFCDYAVREQRAFENMRAAIDMQEAFERVSICNHKSFLPHGAVYKVTKDILEVGDIWRVDMEPLELQNAESKRVAEKISARRLELSKSGQTLVGPRHGYGPARLVSTKGYSTTLAISLMRNLITTQKLRRGDGLIDMPASRRNERVFGVTGSGRSKGLRCGVKLENLGKDYSPRDDSCLKAFVRLCAARAAEITQALADA